LKANDLISFNVGLDGKTTKKLRRVEKFRGNNRWKIMKELLDDVAKA
jgi:hypothetical protein